MTAASQVAAGGRATASQIRSIAPLAAYKSANQTVTSSTTMVNDSLLVVPVAANAIYFFEAFISYQGFTQNISDLKMGWAAPSGSTMVWTPLYLNTSGVLIGGIQNLIGATVIAGSNGVSNQRTVSGFGGFSVGGTAGNLQLQWAQNTSSTTPTTVLAGSIISLWQVG